MTTFLVPVGFALSMGGLLPLSLLGSISGALFGYSILYIINKVFKYIRNIDGIGEGDFDLLLFIGSFTGILGCWIAITIGSILGSFYGLSLALFQQNKNFTDYIQNTKVPFGTFLALGALLFTFAQKYIFLYLTVN